MADFGGHIRILLDGKPLVMRGKFDVEPTAYEYDVVTNQDGSVSRTQKVKAAMFSCTLQDSDDNDSPIGQDWAAIMKGGRYNITIPEDDTGVMHTLTNAVLSGRIKVDRTNGEVTGLEGHTSQYKRTAV